jgi:ribulose-phosphate 3-epimerase
MQAYVSLWSADLLALGNAIDAVAPVADGLHLDVFDGHNVPELLFGPDLVAAVRARTTLPIDVHLNVTDPDYWADRCLAAGADMVTVQASACPDVRSTLRRIRDTGAAASLGLELTEPLSHAVDVAGELERVLVMGTPLGVRGRDLDPSTPARVRALVAARQGSGPLIFVDGGVRANTVEALADAGADGVVPGSLVFSDPEPAQVIRHLHGLSTGCLRGQPAGPR